MAQKYVFSEGIFTARNLRSLGAAAILEIAIAFGLAGILIWQQLHPAPPPPPISAAAGGHTAESAAAPAAAAEQRPDAAAAAAAAVLGGAAGADADPDAERGAGAAAVSRRRSRRRARRRQRTLMAEFQASMKAAIDAAKVYPKEAILAGEAGTTTVSFDYVNGVVSNIHVDRVERRPFAGQGRDAGGAEGGHAAQARGDRRSATSWSW